MFSKVLLRLSTPLLSACLTCSFLNAQPIWERDAGCGTGGTVRVRGGRGQECIKSLALLPDGQILTSGLYAGNLSFIMARYYANGQLDPSFGTNGKSTFRLGGYFGDAKEILLLPDGRFILGASSEDAPDTQVFSVIRFMPD